MGQWEVKELKDELDRRLFRLGRAVLGHKAGGMVAKLKQTMNADAAFNALTDAISKDNPAEYIGAILRRQQDIDRIAPKLSPEERERNWQKYLAKQGRTA